MNYKLIVAVIVIIIIPVIFTGIVHNQLNKTIVPYYNQKSEVKMINYCSVSAIGIENKDKINLREDEFIHKQKIKKQFLNKQGEEISAQVKKQPEQSPVKSAKNTQIASKQKTTKTQTFKATAYDLSIQSCGKKIGSKGYGITANGTNLAGKAREQAMTVAVDPKVIKLGTKVKITFPEPYQHFNGVYQANDTGGAIKGNKIDIFMGDFNNNKTHHDVWDFGVREVQVEIVR